ncbi:helix-turn-helix domain-containing protein [Methylosinus sp. Ce-a6]|uniref:MerR family transcriptional regulator n=1 Tax=Methylosinus sp. Ce-a6 TaxID=2172005 RepID=UPI001358BB42|nr:helix-turn-helix domain-containing protein [Methylosinus sp. Ce-a6]
MAAVPDARSEDISIGELSRLTGVHVETIRYYEKIEMLPAPPRSHGGRRIYDAGHRRTLAFIRHARELGFTLDEIRTLLGLARPGGTSCAQVRDIAAAHLGSVRDKIANLMRLEAILSRTIAQCADGAPTSCAVLDMLETPDAASVVRRVMSKKPSRADRKI